jgi:peptide chain release factor 2
MLHKLENLFSQLLERQNVFLKRLEEIEKILENCRNSSWNGDNIELLKEEKQLRENIVIYDKYKSDYEFYKNMLTSNEINENDKKDVFVALDLLYNNLEEYMFFLLFSSEEKGDCFLELQSGTGGDDAEDLTSILLKMYMKWADYTKRKAVVVDIWPTDSGIRSAIIKISGKNSYGFLKLENGIHRVVRHSPFNSLNKRQTSFISVYTYGVVEEKKFELEEKDLIFEFSRSSGAGGQHVNKTESAVKVIHTPTGITVRCENERSQLMNRQMAIKLLKAKLLEREKTLKQKKESAIEKAAITWGNQIRSYIFNPYQLVKDIRSNYETKNVENFLNGTLLNECLYYNLRLIKN